MHYQGKEGEGSFEATWNQLVNTLVMWIPTLFGCTRVILKDVTNQRELDNLLSVLPNLQATKAAEAHSPTGNRHHYFFRIQGKPIAVLVDEGQPVKIIAPAPVIEYIQSQRKIVLQ